MPSQRSSYHSKVNAEKSLKDDFMSGLGKVKDSFRKGYAIGRDAAKYVGKNLPKYHVNKVDNRSESSDTPPSPPITRLNPLIPQPPSTNTKIPLPDSLKRLLDKAYKPPTSFKAASFYHLASPFSNIDGGYILKNVNQVSFLLAAGPFF